MTGSSEGGAGRRTKYVFVTGGVVSALGKGIASASLGYLLKARGFNVTLQKLDPYLNVDPGTMNPYQHGEVFVTDDGAETDLDIGHYERFINKDLSKFNNITTGQVYEAILAKERMGDFEGGTVQVIPHVTDEIKYRIHRLVQLANPDILIAEIGGTVGDIEGLPFLEAIRQMRLDHGEGNVVFVHLTLVPFVKSAGELKTKPTQHSVRSLRDIGIQPNVLICRTERPLGPELISKIALFCNVREQAVIEARDVENIYQVPLMFHENGLDDIVLEELRLDAPKPDLTTLEDQLRRMSKPSESIDIAVCGKYTALRDSYKSIWEALAHAGVEVGVGVNGVHVDVETLDESNIEAELSRYAGILIPGGFGSRGIEQKILVARYARENSVPYFGICLGLHCAVVEFARNIVGLEKANSTEFDPKTPYPVIDLMPEQIGVKKRGGTMRLGAYDCALKPSTRAFDAYQSEMISERHRHRFELNEEHTEMLTDKGLLVSGTNPGSNLAEIIELRDHPWYVACQFHPEFKSRLGSAHPLFREFVRASLQAKAKNEVGSKK
jgi:CTP synthase